MVACAELTAYVDQPIGRFLVGGPAVRKLRNPEPDLLRGPTITGKTVGVATDE
jgi:hypothetical protein